MPPKSSSTHFFSPPEASLQPRHSHFCSADGDRDKILGSESSYPRSDTVCFNKIAAFSITEFRWHQWRRSCASTSCIRSTRLPPLQCLTEVRQMPPALLWQGFSLAQDYGLGLKNIQTAVPSLQELTELYKGHDSSIMNLNCAAPGAPGSPVCEGPAQFCQPMV